MKLVPLFLVAAIVAALYYFYEKDRDRAPQKAFAQLVEAFKPHARDLKQQFLASKPFVARDLASGRIDVGGLAELSLNYKLRVEGNRVVAELSSSDQRLSGQTVYFEPALDTQRNKPLFFWRCSGGSLLMRYRSKPCRIGTGLRW